MRAEVFVNLSSGGREFTLQCSLNRVLLVAGSSIVKQKKGKSRAQQQQKEEKT